MAPFGNYLFHLEIIVSFLCRCCQNNIQSFNDLNNMIKLVGTNAKKKWGRLARQKFNPNLFVKNLTTKSGL